MSNPILDEIQDACISDEIQETISEEKYRKLELEVLRNEIAESFKHKIFGSDISSLKYERVAVEYFMKLTSEKIIKVFLTHSVAYAYCMEKSKKHYPKS